MYFDKKHHRNPSGLKNKEKWILSVSKWKKNEIVKLYKKVKEENKINKSWSIAFASAYEMVSKEEAKKNISEFTSLITDNFSTIDYSIWEW